MHAIMQQRHRDGYRGPAAIEVVQQEKTESKFQIPDPPLRRLRMLDLQGRIHRRRSLLVCMRHVP